MPEAAARPLPRIDGVYAITPDATGAAFERVAASTAAALECGVGVVQFRNKAASAAERLRQAERLRRLTNEAGALLFVNYLTEAETQKKLNATIGSYVARTDIAGGSALIPEEQRQKYRTDWLPGAYKKHYIEEFVAQVLSK